MKSKEKCKICSLEAKKSEAYDTINKAIEESASGNKDIKIAVVVREVNKKYRLKITPMNASRHKKHYLNIPLENPKKEVEVYSKNGELIYSNITEIIQGLEPKHKLFCEAYANTYNQNATAAYQDVFDSDNYGSSAAQASTLLKNNNVLLYIGHLNQERSKKLGISSAFVITGLMEVYARCMQAEPIIGKDGEPIGIYNFNPNGANKALELIGKHLNMWEKKAEPLKQQIYEQILEKLILNQVSPLAAGLELGKHNLPVPDALKIAMQKMDPKLIEPPKGIETGDIDVSQLSDEELDQIILQGAK